MARISFDGLEDIEKALRQHAESDELHTKMTAMLDAGANEFKDGWTRELDRVIKDGTGELIESIKTQVKARRGGGYTGVVYASGLAKPRRKGGKKPRRKKKRGGGSQRLSNHDKAYWLEMGRGGQPAKPWKSTAEASSKTKAFEAMRRVWEGK
jgi:hypothetical protein